MSKILNIDDMLEAAQKSNMPNYDSHVRNLEFVATRLARALAKHLKITCNTADWQGKEFGGIAAPFKPSFKGQKCPKVIHEGDPGGDWE